jgi:hypothetical protein
MLKHQLTDQLVRLDDNPLGIIAEAALQSVPAWLNLAASTGANGVMNPRVGEVKFCDWDHVYASAQTTKILPASITTLDLLRRPTCISAAAFSERSSLSL